MLNFEVPRELLESRVPKGVVLDTYKGRAYVSLVGFQFSNTQVKGFSVPFHQDFEEVNLRFYVRRFDGSEWRRGVVFIGEIVPRAAIAITARLLYNEPYSHLPMRHHVQAFPDSQGIEVRYEWDRDGSWAGLHGLAKGMLKQPCPGSLDEFITEHYWGYTAQSDGSTAEYQVEHPSWRIWTDVVARVEGNLQGLYPPELVEFLKAPPASSFMAEGSEVTVFDAQKL